jgi:hypothetical protein
MGLRADAVLLLGGCIVILEFKVSETLPPRQFAPDCVCQPLAASLALLPQLLDELEREFPDGVDARAWIVGRCCHEWMVADAAGCVGCCLVRAPMDPGGSYIVEVAIRHERLELIPTQADKRAIQQILAGLVCR